MLSHSRLPVVIVYVRQSIIMAGHLVVHCIVAQDVPTNGGAPPDIHSAIGPTQAHP